MVTCKKFLEELNNFLDEAVDPSLKAEIQQHLDKCPNCFVICDTTKKTINVYKGMQAKALPEAIRSRLMSLIEHKCGSKKSAAEPAPTSESQARS
jgi:anti-sigma factor (TIGR02949 family)